MSIIRDMIGHTLSEEIASTPGADYHDSREIDRLADAVIALLLDRPSIKEILLMDLVQQFMIATANMNGELIAQAHEDAKKLGIT